MSDPAILPPSDLEPERLVAAVATPAIDAERQWKQLEARLAADDTSKTSNIATATTSQEPPIRRRWWIEALTGIAALILFALLLGRDTLPRANVKHTPAGDDGKPSLIENEPDPSPLIAQLSTGTTAERHQAFVALLRAAKTRAAVDAIQPGTDEALQRAVADLHRGYAVVDTLGDFRNADSLEFWQSIWNAEASVQEDIWNVGLDLNDADRQPDAPPSPLVADILVAKYGESNGAAIKNRFSAAYTALRNFQKWERDGRREANVPPNPKFKALLDALTEQGVATAPVVLTILATSESHEMSFPRFAGSKGTYPEDHLRMMVAAVALHRHEAEPLILRFTNGYFASPTIQANAIGALWHLGGHTEKGFPLLSGYPSKDDIAQVQNWWREKHKSDPKGKFDDAIATFLTAKDEQAADEALVALLRGGNAARAAVRADPRANELKRVEQSFRLLDDLSGDTESLLFWRSLWNGEAKQDPWLWAFGIKGEGLGFPPLEQRTTRPALFSGTPKTMPVLRIKFGDSRAEQLAKRFSAAYLAYVNFKNWERGEYGSLNTPEHEKQLQDFAHAGVAAAPAVLKLLEEPVANDTHNAEEAKRLVEITEGKIPPLPTSLDHLRMIVAAERMKLRDAELLILENVALEYPMSRTIQEHGVMAIVRMRSSDNVIVKNFPFPVATQKPDWFATFFAWWLEEETQALTTEVTSGNKARADAAREMAQTIKTRLLSKFEKWNDDPKIIKDYPDVAARLKAAIQNFKTGGKGKQDDRADQKW